MKKSILSVIAIALVSVFAFTSCEKEKTMTDYLTIEKGWTLSVAECTNGYVFDDNTTITNLFEGYVYDCEKDDVIRFNADGYEYLNPGEVICEGEASLESQIGKWEISEEQELINMQIPFMGTPDEAEQCKIISLNKDEFKISYTFEITNDEAKGKPGTYTFVLTYVPAK